MRTTSDPKDKNIKLRLGDDLKAFVDKISVKKGISVSEYIRELIRQDTKNKADTS